MRLRKSMSRIARTLSWSSTYSRIDSSGSIEIDQRFSSISTSWKPTSACSKIREAFSWRGDLADDRPLAFAAAARRPSATATVVLPTPPLPVTKTSRLSRSSGIGLIPSNFARPAGKARCPCEYPRNGISKPKEAEARARRDRGGASDRRRAAARWRRPCPSASSRRRTRSCRREATTAARGAKPPREEPSSRRRRREAEASRSPRTSPSADEGRWT